jgi:hypothetical protein
MQRLLFAEVEDKSQETKTLNVGLIDRLDSPFNLFVNFDHLVDQNKRYIYLYIYSMGEKKIAGWGVYDRNKQIFELSGNCRYISPQLYPMTMNWISQGYKYVANVVTDRPTEIIASYLDTPTLSYDDYRKSKYILAYYNKEIDEAQLESEYLGIWEQVELSYPDPLELIDYLESLKREMNTYELTINRVDITESLYKHPYRELLKDITQKFYLHLHNSEITGKGYEKTLSQCPYLDKCKIDPSNEHCEVHFYEHPDDIDFT